jgi:hypothetical protein
MAVVSLWLVPTASDRPPLKQQIQTLAQQHHTAAFDPHVTLGSGSVQSIQALEPILTGMAAQAPDCFKLTAAGIQTSDRFSKTVFIQLEPTLRLTEWRDQLCTAVALPLEGFDPHVSLLYKDTDLPNKQAIAKTVSSPPSVLTFDELWAIASPNQFQSQTDVQQLSCIFKVSLG